MQQLKSRTNVLFCLEAHARYDLYLNSVIQSCQVDPITTAKARTINVSQSYKVLSLSIYS